MPSRNKVTDTADYVCKAAPEAQTILTTLDQQVRTELPTFTPKIKWNLPFYEQESHYVSIAAYKVHVSLSVSVDLPETLLTAATTAGYATGQKRLNIGLNQAVPTALVHAILALLK
ncbi:DUF1801 domain-containing protein [Lactiplantibacillus garii]|uniref:DUF1801 domain-containing protein n=1 Tax=Lactiplantibacillus garii TaxID=2306423 RepID=A0A3R8QT05_9LACO|nr:DUF1801 domain-containing protein [Lactiplantibacillus garii]RRK11481.1 DUF1801 domain-containing protein [Lactiplantibacillus garii]